MSTTTPNLTKADRGLLVHGTLTMFMEAALKNTTNTAEALAAKQMYQEAVEHLSLATGVRINMPEVVNSLTTDQEAAVLAVTAKRVQQYLTTKFKTMDWRAEIVPPNQSVKNVVDHQVYDHLAIVHQGKQKFYFCASPKGRYAFSDSKYWSAVPK